jgi:hypothetical protein
MWKMNEYYIKSFFNLFGIEHYSDIYFVQFTIKLLLNFLISNNAEFLVIQGLIRDYFITATDIHRSN